MPASAHETSPLELYGHNLNHLAQQGTLAPLAGYDTVIKRIFQILARNNKCNLAILTSDESLHWAIMAEVVRRMAVGEAPDPLSQLQVIALDYEALFAHLVDDTLIRQERGKQRLAPLLQKLASSEDESDDEWLDRFLQAALWPKLEEWIAPTMVLERLQSLFIAMRHSPNTTLLYVDHFHRLFGGEREKYPIDAANILKPALARREVQLIGACTLEQYRQHIERDAAIQRRMQEVVVLNDQEISQMVRV